VVGGKSIDRNPANPTFAPLCCSVSPPARFSYLCLETVAVFKKKRPKANLASKCAGVDAPRATLRSQQFTTCMIPLCITCDHDACVSLDDGDEDDDNDGSGANTMKEATRARVVEDTEQIK